MYDQEEILSTFPDEEVSEGLIRVIEILKTRPELLELTTGVFPRCVKILRETADFESRVIKMSGCPTRTRLSEVG